MTTQIIAGDTVNESSFTGSNDGAFSVRVGPNGAKVTGMVLDNTGNLTVLGTIAASGAPKMQLLSAQATTSGTFKDFTIPAWAKKVTVMLSGVSTTGTSNLLLQLGSASGILTSNYSSMAGQISGTSAGATGLTTNGFIMSYSTAGANLFYGSITLTFLGSQTWTAQGALAFGAAGTCSGAGGLPSALTTVRLTTVNGTDTFDAGSVNVLVEGYE
jgi:hypothetical protein